MSGVTERFSRPRTRPDESTAVVALHGAGEGTRDYVLYRHLHEVLPEVGIGVVTFDRRGEGESTGDSSRGRFEVQAADALAVLDAVGVPPRRLLGSEPGRLDRTAGRVRVADVWPSWSGSRRPA